MLYISYNELQASLDNVNVRIINLVFTILCALVVAIASKTVGALMVSSLMVIPYAASLQLSKSYRASIIISVIISLLSAVIGITLSYYLDIASGGAMVLTSVAILVVSLIINRIFKLNK
jgi:zinc transport system permease protein